MEGHKSKFFLGKKDIDNSDEEVDQETADKIEE